MTVILPSSNVIVWDIRDVGRAYQAHLWAFGDTHVGHLGCNEELLRRDVGRIATDEDLLGWVHMGDAIDAVQMGDKKRFSIDSLPDWLVGSTSPKANKENLKDIVRAQKQRFLQIIYPIVAKRKTRKVLVKGNHENTIERYCERPIHDEIVNDILEMGEDAPGTQLSVGYTGALVLRFHRAKTKDFKQIIIDLHHGHVGGRKQGAKANAMQERCPMTGADIVIAGHSHTLGPSFPVVAVDYDKYHRRQHRIIRPIYSGSYLDHRLTEGLSYADIAAYPPLPTGCVRITIRPFAPHEDDVIRVTS